MNILVVGSGKGSWEMRGLQLGAAIGARVTSTPVLADWAWADVTVLVKRAGPRWAATAQTADVPIVWDVVDHFRQPDDIRIAPDVARQKAKNELAVVRPILAIGATEAQADAYGGVYLPHHSWAGLVPTPARERLQVVGYEGNPTYLGQWHEWLKRACQTRGWSFVVNPPDLRAVDLFVALRAGIWDGWICREWKSGVKLVNAIAAGRPVLMQDTAAAREIAPPGTVIDTEADLVAALDHWADAPRRQRVVEMCQALAPPYRLEAVAARYLRLLEQARESCAA